MAKDGWRSAEEKEAFFREVALGRHDKAYRILNPAPVKVVPIVSVYSSPLEIPLEVAQNTIQLGYELIENTSSLVGETLDNIFGLFRD